jgi:hypothetical protein
MGKESSPAIKQTQLQHAKAKQSPADKVGKVTKDPTTKLVVKGKTTMANEAQSSEYSTSEEDNTNTNANTMFPILPGVMPTASQLAQDALQPHPQLPQNRYAARAAKQRDNNKASGVYTPTGTFLTSLRNKFPDVTFDTSAFRYLPDAIATCTNDFVYVSSLSFTYEDARAAYFGERHNQQLAFTSFRNKAVIVSLEAGTQTAVFFGLLPEEERCFERVTDTIIDQTPHAAPLMFGGVAVELPNINNFKYITSTTLPTNGTAVKFYKKQNVYVVMVDKSDPTIGIDAADLVRFNAETSKCLATAICPTGTSTVDLIAAGIRLNAAGCCTLIRGNSIRIRADSEFSHEFRQKLIKCMPKETKLFLDVKLPMTEKSHYAIFTSTSPTHPVTLTFVTKVAELLGCTFSATPSTTSAFFKFTSAQLFNDAVLKDMGPYRLTEWIPPTRRD